MSAEPEGKGNAPLFGFFGCWSYLCWIYLFVYAPGTSLFPIGSATLTSGIYLFSAVVMILVLVFLARFDALTMKWIRSMPLCCATAGAMSAGTLAYCGSFLHEAAVLFVVGGLFTGTGAAIASVWCIKLLSNMPTRTLFVGVPLSGAMAGACCLTIAHLNMWFIVAAAAVLPIPTVFCLRSASLRDGFAADGDSSTEPLLSRRVIAAALVVSIMVASVAMGFIDAYQSSSWCVAAWYACIVAVLFAAVAIYVRSRDESVETALLGVGLPLVLIAISVVPWWAASEGLLGGALLVVGSICLEAALLMVCALYARKLDYRPVVAYCITRIILTVFYQVGWELGLVLAGSSVDRFGVEVSVVLLVLGVEALIGVVIGTNVFLQRMKFVSEAPMPGEQSAAPTLDIDSLFRLRCLVAQKKYGISERELDVLVLLARGYSSSAIQEELCIASGTVNSHTRNIYAKLGVHSKAEVISLIQSIEPSSQ